MNTTDMIVPESIVTPAGDLILETTHEDPEKLARAFARSSAASMTFLASQKCNIELSASLAYWQEFARNYFRALCRQGISSDGHWSQPHPPDEETLENLLNSAPPMRGLEYLSRETLCRYW